jgi:DNA-binding transcriptional regulator YiaG
MKPENPGWKRAVCHFCGSEVERLEGGHMRRLRGQAKLTMRAMARRAGYSVQFISDVERNRRNCPRKLETAYLRLAKEN